MTLIEYSIYCALAFFGTAIALGVHYMLCDREVDIHDKTMRLREARKLYEDKT